MAEVGGKAYCALGEKIDAAARRRNVRGPHRIANFVWARLGGEGPTGVAWAKILYGNSHPKALTMLQFDRAFELDKEERQELALLYTFPPEIVVSLKSDE